MHSSSVPVPFLFSTAPGDLQKVPGSFFATKRVAKKEPGTFWRWVPAALFLLMGIVILPRLGLNEVYPFSRWEMFSVPSAETTQAFLVAYRASGELICSGLPCPQLFAVQDQSRIHHWTQWLSMSESAEDKKRLRELIRAHLQEGLGVQLVLRERRIESLQVDRPPLADEGVELEKF